MGGQETLNGLSNAQAIQLTKEQFDSLQNAAIALNEFCVASALAAGGTTGGRPSRAFDETKSSADDAMHNLRRLQDDLLGMPPPDDQSFVSTSIPSETEGICQFRQFQRICSDLLSESINFEYGVRSIGSGGPCMEAASSFRKSLRDIQALFRINTIYLFIPDVIKDESPKYISSFPHALNELRVSLAKFGDSFNDFIEVFYNEKLMRLLARMIKLLESGIEDLKEEINTCREFQVFLHDLLRRLIPEFEMLTKYFAHFVEKGIPMIRTSQQNQTDRYLNITTISIFLSAVTASTLQIEGSGVSSKAGIAVAVNSFLFSSLIFSTASAVQSMVAMSWLRSFVRLPRRHLPLWALTWLMEGPTVSLLVAGAFFAIGLVLFVFASKQDTITSAITTSLASLQALGVLFLTVWFYRERWLFRLEGGDPGQKVTKFSIVLSTVEFLWNLARLGRFIPVTIKTSFLFVRSSFASQGHSDASPDFRIADERGEVVLETSKVAQPPWVSAASPHSLSAHPGDPAQDVPSILVEMAANSPTDRPDIFLATRIQPPSRLKRLVNWLRSLMTKEGLIEIWPSSPSAPSPTS
ncbi:hypothetical protein SCHPADRAFT_941218 [Schizopora paradoxa]|uniref:DUF6535 domain-containing protein n=1 Tax=Schizopora paradoxa TaxID=27342 RepID=A0A0H2RSR3_9AGAM|nr:hypothetical protein SCHPADRAFT_941218 [Schizopora paradoxa]